MPFIAYKSANIVKNTEGFVHEGPFREHKNRYTAGNIEIEHARIVEQSVRSLNIEDIVLFPKDKNSPKRVRNTKVHIVTIVSRSLHMKPVPDGGRAGRYPGSKFLI